MLCLWTVSRQHLNRLDKKNVNVWVCVCVPHYLYCEDIFIILEARYDLRLGSVMLGLRLDWTKEWKMNGNQCNVITKITIQTCVRLCECVCPKSNKIIMWISFQKTKALLFISHIKNLHPPKFCANVTVLSIRCDVAIFGGLSCESGELRCSNHSVWTSWMLCHVDPFQCWSTARYWQVVWSDEPLFFSLEMCVWPVIS